MADQVERIDSYSGSGMKIQHGKPTTPAAADGPAGAKAGQGGVVRVNAHTGEVEYEGIKRASDAPYSSSADPFDSGMTQTGFRRARHQLTQDDIVMHGGMETRIRELVSLGLAEPDPAGGFKMKAQQPSTQQETKKQDTVPMERLSQQAESTISTIVSKLGDEGVMAMVRNVAEGKEMKNAEDLASRLSMEPQEFTEVVGKVRDEMGAQAQKVLGMDAETYQAFSDWAFQADPGATREAVDAVFIHGDYRAAKALAARFQREGMSGWSDAELAEIPLGNGAESMAVSKDERGRPLITLPGYGTMLLRAAIQQGLVSVRR